MSNLAYFAADTLGMTLYALKGKLESSEIRSIRLGSWQVELQIDALSDLNTAGGISFWITIAKTLRMYLIVREKETHLFALDAEALKMCGKASGFASDTLVGRLEEIAPAIKKGFRWTDGHWSEV